MHVFATALVLEGTHPAADEAAAALTQLGYEVLAVTSRGEDALALCEQRRPDLLVVGTDLQGMVDAEVTLRMIQDIAVIPAVYLTDQQPTRGNVMRKGGSSCELAACIAHALGVVSWDKTTGPPQDYILPDCILLRHEERMIRLPIADIHYVMDYLNYSSLQVGPDGYLIAISLPLVEHRLAKQGFLRVHRNYLVNRRHLREAHYDELVMERATIPVGRAYRRRVSRQVKETAH